MPTERLVFNPIVLILILFFAPSLLSQECPEIYVPPYGGKPRDCETSIGSTCLITCPGRKACKLCFRKLNQLKLTICFSCRWFRHHWLLLSHVYSDWRNHPANGWQRGSEERQKKNNKTVPVRSETEASQLLAVHPNKQNDQFGQTDELLQ